MWSTDYNTSAELYNLTATLNKLRNHAVSLDDHYVTNWSSILYTDGSTYASRKGSNGAHVFAVLSNQGLQGGEYMLQVSHVADPGTDLTEVISCNRVAVEGPNGTITIPMNQGQPRVYFPTHNLNGSGLCELASSSSASTTPSQAIETTTPTSSENLVADSTVPTGGGSRFELPGWFIFPAIIVSVVLS